MPNGFSLGAVLRLREHKEDMEERALASLETQRQQVEATLGRVRQQILRWAEERGRELGQVGSGGTQQGSYARLALLRDAEKQLQNQLADLHRRREEQQVTYLTSRRAREVLTELKTTHKTQDGVATERREQRRLEDLLLGRWLVQQRTQVGKK